MTILLGALGVALILIVLGDAFETVVLPRQVTRRISLARLFYRWTWVFWSTAIRSIFSRKRQEDFLSWYGPFSLVLLLVFWATGLIIGFGVVHWASGSIIKAPEGTASFGTYLYLSGTTFFTLGLGDVIPIYTFGRGLIALEAGIGFGFLALVVGYLPTLNQSFARREVIISLLDARAGSPPTATEMLRRHCHDRGMEDLRQLFHEWERWSADLMESHLSYPVLAFYRSHHDNESWLGALTAILDTCAFVIVSLEGDCERQAQQTFAITRHAIVDLAQVFNCPPRKPKPDRLPSEELGRMRAILKEAGIKLREGEVIDQQLSELRQMYEPYAYSLSSYLHISIPSWIPKTGRIDNWQTSAWGRSKGFKMEGPSEGSRDEHF
ncbi:MAG TPA: potassium channel family protein [Thermodesulfobacteriota bacterium]|nr:potassium channel family protein [Thermodesulfobacteriota bacterium]